jgi:O-antigen/teichoic acid export membrane protein
MVGIWKSSSEVGIFAVANRTAALTSFILIAVNSIAAPKFAALYSQGNLEDLGKTAQHAARLMVLMAGPVLLFFLVFPGWVMSMFGDHFESGSLALSIIAAGQFVNVVTGSVGYLLMMCGYERLMRNTTAISAIVNIVANVLLIPRFGINGAAVASAITLISQNLIAAALVWRRLGIWTIPIFRSQRRIA